MKRIIIISTVLAGCAYQEDLPEQDLRGTVRIPIDAIQFDYGEDLDNLESITDARGLGPVYLGVFPSVQEGLYDFPHPEIGPILNTSAEGDTYPYGGTTIGRFDWACYQELVCKVSTGRFTSYDDILEYFADVLGDPVSDSEGVNVANGIEYQEHCYELLFATDDHEMLFLSETPDFEVDGDYLVATDIEIPQVPFTENMAIWGWLDMPSRTYEFSTCDNDNGEVASYYNEFYDKGTNYIDVLNFPGNYIDPGDWVVQDPFLVTDPETDFDLEIGFNYVDE
jgi:hypothetical protein